MLGTVQFGLAYGVANKAGTPAFSEICAMLEEAAAAGINCLDTAAAYGESEEVLGKASLKSVSGILFISSAKSPR